MSRLRGVRAAAVGVAVLGLAACETPTVPLNESSGASPAELPYDFRVTIPTEDNQPDRILTFHWPLGSTVRVLVVDADAADGRPSLEEALAAGMSRWNRAALFGEFRLERTSDPGQADAVLRWPDSPVVYSTPEGCTGPITGGAATRVCFNSSADSLVVWPRTDGGRSRVVLRVVVNRPSGLSEGELDILVSHELGHVVGILNHSDMSDDLMWAAPQSAELSDRDRLTLRSLYQTESDLGVAGR